MTAKQKHSVAVWIGLGVTVAAMLLQAGMLKQQIGYNSTGLDRCAEKVDKHSEDIAEIKADLKFLVEWAKRKND